MAVRPPKRTVARVHVLESFVQAKTGRCGDSEDVLVVTDDFVAVIDGATDKHGRRFTYSGRHVSSGRFAALACAEAVRGMPGRLTAPAAFAYVSATFDAELSARLPGLLPHQRPSASVVIYSAARRQVWRLGDCHFRIGEQLYLGSKVVDELTSSLRAAGRDAVRGTGGDPDSGGDIGREVILPFLRLQGALMHHPGPYGYGAVDGRPFRPAHLTVVDVPHAASGVVLASDGYPYLLPTLAASEAALAEGLARDPSCEREMRGTKGVLAPNVSFDDRCYVRLAV